MTTPKLVPIDNVERAAAAGSEWDAVVAVAPDLNRIEHPPLRHVAEGARAVDAQVGAAVALIVAPELAGGRAIIAPTGPLDRDYDDVRRFADAARAGITRAREAGSRSPLLLISGIPDERDYRHAVEASLLAGLSVAWDPLEAREADAASEPIDRIGFASADPAAGARIASWVHAVETGRRGARDLGGTEPERMAPPRFAEYCEQLFAGTEVAVEVLSDLDQDYPLLAAVGRASMVVERHRPRVIRLEYTGPGTIQQTLLLAGKGITYDTGGADLKTGGHMAGMSRDKGGGAAVAGFVRAIAELQPAGVRVIAEIGAVRNSIGADAYVADEILTSHAGVRVRIGNTDAEGRLVLADLLSHLRQRAVDSVSPRLFSVATLTGHAVRAAGGYSIALDNGPARRADVAGALADAGDLYGDPFEVSRLRREDYHFVRPRTAADDVLSCNNVPSTMTDRGHQFPMAFLAIASGLDQHGRQSDRPLAFTHIDVAGSATEGCDWQHGRPTGAPIVAMCAALLPG